MTILLVEDDRALARSIMEYLELEELTCDYADNGVGAIELTKSQHYQVIVLDINLPRLDGFSVCEQLRKSGNDTPIIMLTAKDRLEDKLTGFNAGTDDYLVKPFAMKELVARIKALSGRRSNQVKKLSVGELELDLSSKQAKRGETTIELSPTGFKILELLMRASPDAVSKETIVQEIWGDQALDSNNLKVHIHKLRKDIDSACEPAFIVTIKSVGYAIREPHAD
ncbi:DNA-binding response regulator [Photobacterium sanctipauli]|uniref:DNA-binding response regulator n=1 Tax=Photobacterium sanctipauli TaxID=1342794 RepID=A0A2T3NWY1_9GAMM|nr:response regulator transcription factor [Photobacterium sanctipauli]PSW20775.1 DNA-binding response regulator [Photobacterium sanctipauli]